MAIAVNALLTWTRMANARRAAVVSELMPGGLDDLDQCSQEETREAIKGFKTLPTAADRFSLSALTTKRIVQLALWVKDRVRLGQPAEFESKSGNRETQRLSFPQHVPACSGHPLTTG
jgi:hypothetical protein